MFTCGLIAGVLPVLFTGGRLAAAHMEISYPAPLRSKYNPYAANYPCKGYQSDLGTPAGRPTATFVPGGSYDFTVVGDASHNGGSCQVSLSYDKGKTFTVIQSIEGGCPLSSSYSFNIPSDAPQGEALWAWTWNNEIGNREFYMNCAAVRISGGRAKRGVEERAATAFFARPAVFVANLGNGCIVPEGTDVKYPNPGPEVVTSGSKLGTPFGNCGASSAGSNVGSSSGGSGSSTVQAIATLAPTTSTAASLPRYVQSLISADRTYRCHQHQPNTISSLYILPNPSSGVFNTVPSQGATSTAPTTLVVSTRLATNTPAATGSRNSSSAGANLAGTACTNEGAWNCLGGTSWQRCASGTWSTVQPVAPGTVCTAGESDTLDVKAAASNLTQF
jgi:hypothetical protein